MKKTFIPIAFIAVFATSMVSCQKETLQEPTPIVANIGNARTIKYSIDGIEYFIKLHGEKEWMQFVNTMMELSTQGHDITFAEANSVQREYSAKEIYTFTTKDFERVSCWFFYKIIFVKRHILLNLLRNRPMKRVVPYFFGGNYGKGKVYSSIRQGSGKSIY